MTINNRNNIGKNVILIENLKQYHNIETGPPYNGNKDRRQSQIDSQIHCNSLS